LLSLTTSPITPTSKPNTFHFVIISFVGKSRSSQSSSSTFLPT
jgi:hypothetical protein